MTPTQSPESGQSKPHEMDEGYEAYSITKVESVSRVTARKRTLKHLTLHGATNLSNGASKEEEGNKSEEFGECEHYVESCKELEVIVSRLRTRPLVRRVFIHSESVFPCIFLQNTVVGNMRDHLAHGSGRGPEA